MMADGSDDPEDLVRYHGAAAEGTTARSDRGSFAVRRSTTTRKFKLVLNRIVNSGIRVLFRSGYNDTTNAFKAYRREVIDTVQPLLSNHFNLTVEIPLKAIVRGHSYAVVPISLAQSQRRRVEALAAGDGQPVRLHRPVRAPRAPPQPRRLSEAPAPEDSRHLARPESPRPRRPAPSSRMKTALVTGSSGLIGSEMVATLDRLGLGRSTGSTTTCGGTSSGRTATRPRTCGGCSAATKRFEHHELDIRDRAGVGRLLAEVRPSLIVHSAAQPSHDLAARRALRRLRRERRRDAEPARGCARELSRVAVRRSSRRTRCTATRRTSSSSSSSRRATTTRIPSCATGSTRAAASTRRRTASSALRRLRPTSSSRSTAATSGCRRCASVAGASRARTMRAPSCTASSRTSRGASARAARTASTATRASRSGTTSTPRTCARRPSRSRRAPRAGAVYNLGGGRPNSISILEAIARLEELDGQEARGRVRRRAATRRPHLLHQRSPPPAGRLSGAGTYGLARRDPTTGSRRARSPRARETRPRHGRRRLHRRPISSIVCWPTGFAVTVLDNLSTGLREHVPAEAAFVEGDVRDARRWSRCVRERAVRRGLSCRRDRRASGSRSRRRRRTSRRTSSGRVNVLRGCIESGVPRLLNASSMTIYGEPDRDSHARGRRLRPGLVLRRDEVRGRALRAVTGASARRRPRGDVAADVQRLRPAAEHRRTPTRACSRSSSATSCAASRSRSTATASRPATSSTSTTSSMRGCASLDYSRELRRGAERRKRPGDVRERARRCRARGVRRVAWHVGGPHEDAQLGDQRRSAADTRALSALGWSPAVTLEQGMSRTVDWARVAAAAG